MTCQPVIASGWDQPPQHPVLTNAQTVDVWLIGLDQPPDCIAMLAKPLIADEQHRAARFATDDLANAYRVGRGALRVILAQYVGQSPQNLQFSYSQQGKPHLQDFPLHFNVTHHDTLALIAVAQHTVGIDIEAAHPFPDMDAVAEHHFSPLELSDYFVADDRVGVFYRCWTRKEAIIKADSRGLTIPLKDFAVTVTADHPPRIRSTTPTLSTLQGWSLADLNLPAGSIGAVAYTARLDRVRCYAFGG